MVPRPMSDTAQARRWRLNPWWLAPLAVVLAAVMVLRQRAAVPEPGDWQAATEAIRAGLEPGDGVAWAPYWAGEGRLFMHGLPGFHLTDVEAADLSRFRRVWLMGAFGRDADDLPPGHTPVERRIFGEVTLDLVEVGGERVVGDLRADLEQARVSRSGRRVERCDFWDGRGWHCKVSKGPEKTRRCLAQPISRRHRQRRRDPHCGLDPWLNVSRDVRVIGDFPRRCIWFHPMAGKTLRLHWPTAPDGASLVIDHGFTDKVITDHTRKETRTRPATLRVRRGGVEGPVIGQQPVPPEKGWRRWRLPLDGPLGDGLTIEVDTEATPDGHLCIDATVRAPAPEGA